MDIFAHTLWTNAGARGVNALAKRKHKKFRLHVGWAAFWGVSPDFFAFTIPFVIGLYNLVFLGGEFTRKNISLGGMDLGGYLYQYSHSLVIFSLVFILVWAIYRRPRWEMLGWALHILIDIPSHSVHFYPTPFLFPISEYRFPYGVSWAHPLYMIINYSLLALTWGCIFYRKAKKRYNEKYEKKIIS